MTGTGTLLPSATVINESQINPSTRRNFATVVDKNEKFTVKGKIGGNLHVVSVGFHDKDVVVNAAGLCNIQLEGMSNDLNEVVFARLAVSPHSSWLGAKVGFNFDGITEPINFFLGAATH